MTTINSEIFWSVLAAIVAYGVSKHLLAVTLDQLLGKQSAGATNNPTGRSSMQKDPAA